MTCERVRQLLSDYLDGELSSAVTTRIQSHLYGCPGCEQEHQALRRTVQLLAGHGRQRVPIDCRDLVLARLRAGERLAPAPRRDWWRGIVPELPFPLPATGVPRAAAVAGLALFCLGGAWLLRAGTGAPGGAQMAANGGANRVALTRPVAQRLTSEEELTRFHAPDSFGQAMGRDNGIILVSDWVDAP
jgi:anti-sigma factor RsiW